MKKKLISIILAIVMIVGIIPAGALPVFAEGEPDYFYIKNIGNKETSIYWVKSDNPTTNMWYSINDKTTWKPVDIDTSATTAGLITLNVGDIVYFKGNRKAYGTYNYTTLKDSCSDGSTSLEAGGDITTLLNADSIDDNDCGGVTDLTPYGSYIFYSTFYGMSSLNRVSENLLPATTLAGCCYASMFYGCTSLVNAPKLPATSLAELCYAGMFNNCSKLMNAPELPATTLAKQCYSSMFMYCSSLVNAPELPATTLAKQCYSSMFMYCSSLVNAPDLPATTLAESCYSSMFHSCRSLVNAPDLPATTLASSCYSSMFAYCSSLVNAPDLPATTLAESCYSSMFRDCKSLVNAPDLPATMLAESCYSNMFHSCESLVNAPELPATTLAKDCYHSMFYECKLLVNAPELPATTLAEQCYYHMFNNCSSLVNAPDLPATTLAHSCYSYMFFGCTSLVNAPDLPATTLAKSCYSNMFSGCTSLVSAPDLPATVLAGYCYNAMFANCKKITDLRVNFNKWGSSTSGDSDYNATYNMMPSTLSSLYCPEDLEITYNGGNTLPSNLSCKVTVHTPVRAIVTGEKDGGKLKYSEHFVYSIANGEDNYQTGVMGRQEKLGSTAEGRLIFKLTEEQLNSIKDKLVIIGTDNKGNTINVEIDCAYTYIYAKGQKITAEESDCAAFVIVDSTDVDIENFSALGYYRVYNGSCLDEDNVFYAANIDAEAT